MLQFIKDYLHERRIRRERRAVVNASTMSDRALHARRMKALIAERSAEQVARMERARGLR